MNRSLTTVLIFLTLLILGCFWAKMDRVSEKNFFAYAAGTTVQTTGEGALIYCHGAPVYLPIKHTAPMIALLRRYVEAVCS